MTVAPGQRILLVIGILYIAFSGYTLFGAGSELNAPAWDILPDAALPWAIFYGYAVVVAVFGLFIGIMAVVNRARPEKAGLLRTLGIIAVALVVVEAALSFTVFTGALAGITAILTLIVGLVLPVLYIFGAQKNIPRKD
jgi:hypothetical protein